MQAHSIVVAGILQGIEAKQARFCSNLGFFVVIKVEGGSASHVKLFVPIVQCTHTQPTNPLLQALTQKVVRDSFLSYIRVE